MAVPSVESGGGVDAADRDSCRLDVCCAVRLGLADVAGSFTKERLGGAEVDIFEVGDRGRGEMSSAGVLRGGVC